MKLLIGTRKGLFTLLPATSSPGGWSVDSVDFLGEPVFAGTVDPSGTTYVALGTGHFGAHVWRRNEPGGDWVEVAAPAYPPRPDDATDVSFFTQEPWPWALELIWTIESGHPSRPGELWAGTLPGGLFRSRDRGDSWELIESLWNMPDRSQWSGGGFDWPGVHSVSVDPRDPDTVLIAVSCGGAWITNDGGGSWAPTTGMRNEYMPPGEEYEPNAQDPHRVVRCAAVPDVVWNQHHNGCFRSVDGGRTWTEIVNRPPSVFGFAVAAHPTNPEVAWFVPAIKDELRIPVDGRLVVVRTSDGGKSFETFGEGLPDTHAYDLIHRHGLDVDPAGQVLAMGSTTGSLWVSVNGGEQWQAISSNLPPIHFVRFVPNQPEQT